jgi:tetratricopeptide (TPR) repeat protein
LLQLARDALLQLGIEISPEGELTAPESGILVAAALAAVLLVCLWLRQRSGARPAEDEQLERTVQQLIENNEYARAGELRMSQGQFEKALALFLNSGNPDKAALCYLALKQPARAAAMYVQMGRHAEAAHYFQSAGDWREAAASLHTLGSDREAAELYERAGDYAKAAHLLRSIDDADSAARLFERAGLGAEAASALLQARRHEPAAMRRAAALFRAAGQPTRAGECLAAAGDWLQAAEAFEESGEHTLAAQAYERVQRWEDAGACYERSGALPEAKTNFEKAGDQLRAAETALRMGYLLDAGRSFYRLGSYERAIETLQQIPEPSPQSRSATILLGRIFLEKGLFERSAEKLESIPLGQPPSKDELEVLEMLAVVYERNGDAGAAVQALERIIEVDENYSDVQAKLEALQERVWGESNAPTGYYEARYQIQGELGRGGMGVVYLAQDTELDRPVAIKFLPGELAAQENAVQMFRQEARASAAMNHPHIVHVYDTATIGGRPCIVMEYVAGKTAREAMRANGKGPRGGLSPGLVAEIGRQTCIALAYAHAQNVIHRDVKPGNIMISERGQVKLMDFGISKVLQAGAGQTQAKGTPQYMPPEQILGREVDGRTDLYALGISMFEMVTGRRPFIGQNVVDQQLNRPIPDPREMVPDIPEPLVRVIRKACAKSADQRYASADEMALALADVLQAVDETSPLGS